MKYVLLTLTVLTLAGTTATYKVAQAASQVVNGSHGVISTPHTYCHQEIVCGPGGCHWVTICN